MKYSFALLLLVATSASASQAQNDEAVAKWNACQDKTSLSGEAAQLEQLAGKTSVIDLIYKACGPRPIVVGKHGRLALDEEDCALLFHWNNAGVCVPEDTMALDLFTRTLDQHVFDRAKYAARCQRNFASSRIESYKSFHMAICEVQGRLRREN